MVNYNKSGFSLLEAMVVMSIAAIFVAVIATVVPHKAKPKLSAEAHGGFECYWDNDKLNSRNITVGSEGEKKEESGSCCTFKPNAYNSYLIFNVVGGGSYGGTTDGGSAGIYSSAFIPIPGSSYQLCPGKGGTSSHKNGYPTAVNANSSEIIKVSGGSETTTAENAQFKDILDVYVVDQMPSNVTYYGCPYTARAEKGKNNSILVTFCDTATKIVTREITFRNDYCYNDRCKAETIMNSPVVGHPSAGVLSRLKPGTVDTWEYYDVGAFNEVGIYNLITDAKAKNCRKDNYNKITSMSDPMCPSRYKLEIKLNIQENGEDGAVSSLTKYADMMNYTELKKIKPGNGGKKNDKGHPGAVLVTW